VVFNSYDHRKLRKTPTRFNWAEKKRGKEEENMQGGQEGGGGAKLGGGGKGGGCSMHDVHGDP